MVDRALTRRISLIGCLAVVTAAGLSALPHSNWWWGQNLLHFMPLAVRVAAPVVAVAMLLILAGWPLRRAAAPEPEASVPEPAGAGVTPAIGPGAAAESAARAGSAAAMTQPGLIFRASPLWLGFLAALLALPLFHLLRARHVLLGDGSAILARLTLGQPPETRSAAFDLAAPLVVAAVEAWRGVGVNLQRAGLLSTLVGALTTGIVTWLLITRARGGKSESARLLAPLLLLQPALQLFCGYLETYSLLAAALILFFLGLDDAAARRRGPAIPVLAALAAFLAHPLGALTWPGLLGIGWSGRGRSRLWLILPAGLLIALFALFRIPSWSTGPFRWLDPLTAVAMFGDLVTDGLAGIDGTRPLMSLALQQTADLINQVALTAAPALVLLLALALGRAERHAFAAPAARAVLFGTLGFVALRALIRTPLGAPRDWDLFAPVGIGLTAWAGTVLGQVVDARRDAGHRSDGALGRLLGQIVVLSLFFTGPWITLQLWPARAVDRHIAILEGSPRPEPAVLAAGHTVMGDRFTGLGQSYLAAQAYRAAYRAKPSFDRAWRSGLAYLACGRVEDAGGAFQECSRLRPRDWRVWNELGNALTGLNHYARADSVLRRAIELNPRAADPRIHLARTLAMQGREAEARALLETARPLLDPKSGVARDFQKLDDAIPKSVE